ncbi:hypothetical protein [Salinirubrum litoreum]|uniref:Uncharacterized protein n=1 Tax=Salinirubrum litoreum TaxID=1126234 RepID=A0ABD5REC0_9EURY|nr:hypothetical protein [Salinirubrum litoreum]
MSKDHGDLDAYDWSDSMSGVCSGASDSDWTAAYGVNASGSTSEEWNQIDQNGSNIWRFFFHFRERPENLVIDVCQENDTYQPEPHNFRFVVELADAEDDSQIYLKFPEPQDGEDDSENTELGLAMDILSNVGGLYTDIGFAVGDYLISGDGSNTYVNQENNASKLTWDVDVTGEYDDLPLETDEARGAQVSCAVKNEYADGTHSIKYQPEYTFLYRETGQTYCSCSINYERYKTVAPGVIGFASYEAIS